MTPERIAEVRNILSGMNERSQLFPITVGDLNSLLAALEEAEKKAVEWEQHARTEYMIHNEIQDELREAQQTIARQREELMEYKNKQQRFPTEGYTCSPHDKKTLNLMTITEKDPRLQMMYKRILEEIEEGKTQP